MNPLALSKQLVLSILTTSTLALMQATAAGQASHGHEHDHVGYVSSEIMNRPVQLRRGIGLIHQPVTTSSAQAQKFYDQGQAYLHSYMWIEAARSFHQSLRLDPKLAMAYVGLSYAYSPLDYDAAQDALIQAKGLTQSTSDYERAQIAIRERQLDAMLEPQNSAKLSAFRASIDAALANDPNSVELLLLRGNAEEPTPFGDGQACVSSAIPYYSQVLELSPDNFPAHHYLAHCYENSGSITEALAHAESYVRLAPSIAHAHHMLGHELRRSGRVEEAITQFRKADQIERQYYVKENVPGFMDWHHAHNLSLLANCYQSIGQMRAAESLLREEIRLPAFTDYAMLNRSNWTVFLLNRSRAKEAAAAAEALQRLPSPLARSAGFALGGEAAIELGLQDKAEKALQQAEETVSQLSAPDVAAAQPYIEGLRAELHISSGARDQGYSELRDVVKRIRAVGNPDAWAQGLFQLELFGSFARKTEHWELAEEIARAMIDHDPKYAGSHYAMALIAQHHNDRHGADNEFTLAAQLWTAADSDLPELAYARRHSRGLESGLSADIQKTR
jgi:tetratricopeptide (TPR) repeat protein